MRLTVYIYVEVNRDGFTLKFNHLVTIAKIKIGRPERIKLMTQFELRVIIAFGQHMLTIRRPSIEVMRYSIKLSFQK